MNEATGCFLIVVACVLIAILAYAFEIVILLAIAVGLFFLFRTIIRGFTSEFLFEGVSLFLWGITIFCAVYVYALNFRFSDLIPERCNYVTYLKEKSEYLSNSTDEITFLFNHNHSPVDRTEINDAKKNDQRTNLYLDFYVGMRYLDFQNKFSSYIASGDGSFEFMEDKSFGLEGLFSDKQLFGVRLRARDILGSYEINDVIDKIKRKYGEYQFTYRNRGQKQKQKSRGLYNYDYYLYYYTYYEHLWKTGNKNILLYYEVEDNDYEDSELYLSSEVYLYIYDPLIYTHISDKLKIEQSIKEKKQRELDSLEKQKQRELDSLEKQKQKEVELQKEIEYKKKQKLINNMQNDF